eukprot:GHVQ01024159.1.p2 GENE.GHVQ01024159.1~~GHVQ01024159.1.p2  ORF type:complete len:156 (-),score=4.62 GHVQ01024159.1:133-600(-)
MLQVWVSLVLPVFPLPEAFVFTVRVRFREDGGAPQVLLQPPQLVQGFITASTLQTGTLQFAVSCVGAVFPVPVAGVLTDRVLFRVLPLPQLLVHELQFPHWFITASTLQTGTWHGSVSDVSPVAPAPDAGVSTSRVRVRSLPSPQLLLQSLHSPH